MLRCHALPMESDDAWAGSRFAAEHAEFDRLRSAVQCKNHIDKFRESRSITIACQPNKLPSSCYASLVQAKPHSHYKHVANHPHDPLNVLKSEGSKHVNAHAAQGRIQPFCLGFVGPHLQPAGSRFGSTLMDGSVGMLSLGRRFGPGPQSLS